MRVRVNAYKPSGKWYGDAEAEIPDHIELWDPYLLLIIAKNQKQLAPSVIYGRDYHVTVEPVGENVVRFFCHMFPAKPESIKEP